MKETALLPRAINGIKQLGDALVSQSSSKLAKAIGLEEPDGGDHELRDFAADNFMVVPGRVVHLRHLTSADPSHPTAEVREPTAFSEIKLSLPRMFTDHTPLSVSTARADGGVGCTSRGRSGPRSVTLQPGPRTAAAPLAAATCSGPAETEVPHHHRWRRRPPAPGACGPAFVT